ncbi:uncharacterized protein L201_005064 [Kwoniella dendrophila CBS 6074]|uniref:Uncharacterized protein n=1 Tax=Kwoniella dendrophila CBS 6074 TaxID=1295534 RepID=A0AAX4JXG8_9TREE
MTLPLERTKATPPRPRQAGKRDLYPSFNKPKPDILFINPFAHSHLKGLHFNGDRPTEYVTPLTTPLSSPIALDMPTSEMNPPQSPTYFRRNSPWDKISPKSSMSMPPVNIPKPRGLSKEEVKSSKTQGSYVLSTYRNEKGVIVIKKTFAGHNISTMSDLLRKEKERENTTTQERVKLNIDI